MFVPFAIFRTHPPCCLVLLFAVIVTQLPIICSTPPSSCSSFFSYSLSLSSLARFFSLYLIRCYLAITHNAAFIRGKYLYVYTVNAHFIIALLSFIWFTWIARTLACWLSCTIKQCTNWTHTHTKQNASTNWVYCKGIREHRMKKNNKHHCRTQHHRIDRARKSWRRWDKASVCSYFLVCLFSWWIASKR